MTADAAPHPPRLLILGGTTEARALAEALARRGDWQVVTSLAGRTAAPRPPPGILRSGGFGGTDGLRAWLRDHRPAAVVDATHPFAAAISAQAAAACAAEGIPRLRLDRPPWPAEAGWTRTATLAEAAARLPGLGRRVLLTIGRRDLALFAARPVAALVARVVTPPSPPPPGVTLVVGRGPFAVAEEEALMRRHRIDVVVAKNSGGTATAAKLDAARRCGAGVLMVDRPPPPAGPVAETVEAVLDWLERPEERKRPDRRDAPP
jgi:precorrin-6A/cobalt-precorrin-6A reductase